MANADATAPTEGALRRHVWVAVLLSFFVFGLGQLYTGRVWWLVGLITAWTALLVMFQTDIPSTFIGFAIVVVGVLAMPVVALVHAGVTAWRNPLIARQPFHRWYVYLAYTVAFLIAMPADEAEFRSLFAAYHPYRASSRPMEPGLIEGEFFLTETAHGATKRELTDWLASIVVVSWPGEDGAFVYRLVAVGGQRIAVSDRKLLVDGKALQQKVICSVLEVGSGQMALRSIETLAGRSYVVQNFDDVEFGRDTEEVSVPDDQFFVVGDTRENSNDSRFRGPVANENYRGRALFIFWSSDWRRIGKTLVPGASIEASEYCPAAAR
ncbi:MAG: signal peptidase I [Micropepsaceae bacterium]